MIKWLKWAGIAVSVAFFILITSSIYRGCTQRGKLKSRLFTYFLSADSINQLYTGFSLVAIVDFYDKDRKFLEIDSIFIDKKKKIDGICYRLYEVGIGYPSLKQALQRAEPGDPEILSVNAIDSRVIVRKGKYVQFACDSLDSNPAGRRVKLLAQMIRDKQWKLHQIHARKLIAALKGPFGVPKDSLQMHSGSGDFGFSTTFLANLKLTFATIGTFTIDKKFLIVFDLPDEFYIRKDIAEVTYGSQLEGLELESQPFWWTAPEVARITLKEPEQISINRHISMLVSSKGFKLKEGKDLKEYTTIDAYMLANLNKQLERIHDRAVEQSKQLSRLFLDKFSINNNVELKIRFSGGK